MTRCVKPLVALAVLLLGLAPAAGAVVLWDQMVLDLNGPGIANCNAPGFNGVVAYSVNDVTVPAPGWVITRITQYYSAFNAGWVGGVTQGLVYVQPKTGGLPTINPGGPLQPMSAAHAGPIQGQPVIAVTASGLNIALNPGEYWVGITPNATAGINGANLQWPTAMLGAPVATYAAPGPWANLYGAYDGTIRIEGDVPVPVEASTWGGIKSLYN
jgi:hypothetical protein